MRIKIPRETNQGLLTGKKRKNKPASVNGGTRAENIGKTGFQLLVDDEVIRSYDHVGCECDHDECDSIGIDFIVHLFNGLMLGVQVKKNPGSGRKREKLVEDHYKKHPNIQCVIFISLTKPTAHMDVYWAVIEFLKGAAADPPIDPSFLEPKRVLQPARH